VCGFTAVLQDIERLGVMCSDCWKRHGVGDTRAEMRVVIIWVTVHPATVH
jgi:hypothetical protein